MAEGLKQVQVSGMVLNHISKYINPTIDLNYAIHNVKYLSLLDWRQTTYLSSVLSMEMTLFFRTIH